MSCVKFVFLYLLIASISSFSFLFCQLRLLLFTIPLLTYLSFIFSYFPFFLLFSFFSSLSYFIFYFLSFIISTPIYDTLWEQGGVGDILENSTLQILKEAYSFLKFHSFFFGKHRFFISYNFWQLHTLFL